MIQIQDLSYFYLKDKPIINNISTSLEPGKIYGLLGLNGEGKTTLLKLLAGILFPKYGTINLNAINSTQRNKEFYSRVYFLPDQPVTFTLTLDKFISIYSAFYADFSFDFLNQALEDLKLDRKNNIKSLSLGQQKKFHLAFALAANTKYLLLDEPTNGLDIPSKSIFRKLLAKRTDDDKTIIISTHLVKDVENLLDHILILKDGQLVLDMSSIDITAKYKFNYATQNIKESLYAENSIANYKSISDNVMEEESSIDIELLFNAIQQGKL